jgi:hypothetical protein
MRSFSHSLREGHAAERRWVESLRTQGLCVGHGKKIVVAKANPKTIHVETPDAVCLFSVEIKERSLSFTSPKDYPYDTVFIDDIRGMEREPYKHLIYVYMSRPTGQWCWLTTLDRTDEWQEATTFDRGRNHEVKVLACPKKFLRPATQLTNLIFPQSFLDLVDGDTGFLCGGGGETERRDTYAPRACPLPGVGDSPLAGKTCQHMG